MHNRPHFKVLNGKFLSLFTVQSMLKRRISASFQFLFSSERQAKLPQSEDKWALTTHFTRHSRVPSGIFSFSLGLGLHWESIIVITKPRAWSCLSQQRSHLERKAGKFLSPVVNTRDVTTTHLVITSMSFVHPSPGWAHDTSVPTEGKLARGQK